MKVYDSLNSTVPLQIQAQIASIVIVRLVPLHLKYIAHSSKRVLMIVPFLLLHTQQISAMEMIWLVCYFQEKLRHHLIDCLKHKKMLPFPSRLRCHINPVIKDVEVFCCICRLPETDEEVMVACDDCNEWYHVSCEDIPNNVLASA